MRKWVVVYKADELTALSQTIDATDALTAIAVSTAVTQVDISSIIAVTEFASSA